MSRHIRKREALKAEFFPGAPPFVSVEKGWFKASRTLPLVLSLLASKKISGKLDPSRVYVGLLARHFDTGLVEISAESDCAFEAGYTSARGVRTWRERMKILEKMGFIQCRAQGANQFRYLLLSPVVDVIEKLDSKRLLPPGWKDAYYARGLESGERESQLDVPA